jgi:hypothetical protein
MIIRDCLNATVAIGICFEWALTEEPWKGFATNVHVENSNSNNVTPFLSFFKTNLGTIFNLFWNFRKKSTFYK